MFVSMGNIEEKVYHFFIIPNIIPRECTEIIKTTEKIDNVIIARYFLSPSTLSVNIWADNIRRNYDLFYPQIFLSIFNTFIFRTN